jgi:acetolactate synthase-1/2/3 large subunit
MKASDLLVECLENEGVEYIFGVAGEENLDLLDSISQSSIKYISTRHEQAAGFMAAFMGKLTGKPGVCLATLGPGATNLITAVAYAYLGATPMIVITGQKPIKSEPQGLFQKIDIVAMMKPITKFSKQIVHEDSIPGLIRQAVKLAEQERPGPVHLELPMDIAKGITSARPLPITQTRRPIAEGKSIKIALEMLKNAKKPLILVGAGANRKLISKMLTEFVDKTQIPFFTTQMGKGVIDERHPLYLGTATFSKDDYLHCIVDQADLIINVGHDIIEKPPFIMSADSAKVIHINFFPADIDEIYHPHLEIVGDIANTLWQLLQDLQEFKHWDNTLVSRYKALIDDKTSDNTLSDKFPLSPQRIVADLRKATPDDGILALDNGMYKLWFTRNYRCYAPNTLLVDNALATMGAGLPSAIAAKLIFPQREVVAIAGDGGFMMNSQELETAVRLGIDLTVVIIRDNGFGMIKWKQKNEGFRNFGLEFSNPDFVVLAESYGAKGFRVKEANDFSRYLELAKNTPGVKVIDCPVDYTENEKVFDQELKNKVCLI